MSALDDLPALIEEGSTFTYENFAPKGSFGYPSALSANWLVWLHHVTNVVEQIGSGSIAGKSILRGCEIELVGNDADSFSQAHQAIINGLKAAERIYAPRIPAADRVVSLGHNSPEQKEALEKVDEVIAAVQGDNDFPGDDGQKEQIVAELSAARRILEASKVRVGALASTLAPSLKWLLEKAAGSMIGKAASAAWDFFVAMHIF